MRANHCGGGELIKRKAPEPTEYPQTSFTCDESDVDLITVSNSRYDIDAVYITASEHNDAGIMVSHIGFFLNPSKAIQLAERIRIEAEMKNRGG